MAQKCFRKMGNFGQHAPRHQSKMISRYHGLGTLFCSLKRFGRFETVASLDAYQITKYQFFSKLIIFCCLIFEEFEKSFWIRNFKANCLSRRDQKVYSIFSKSCLSGHQGFQKISKWKKVFIEMGSLPTVITNSFRTLVVQNSKTFSPLFIHFLLHWDLTSF